MYIDALKGLVQAYVIEPCSKYRIAKPNTILAKISTLALPLIALVAFTNAEGAQAGALTFLECMKLCLGATLGGFWPACAVVCGGAAVVIPV